MLTDSKTIKIQAPMNKLIHFTTILIFVTLTGNAYSNLTITPPDSVTSIVDKTAAAYIIEEGKTLYGEAKIKDALITTHTIHDCMEFFSSCIPNV